MSWTKNTGIPRRTLAAQTGEAVFHHVAILIASSPASAAVSSS